MEACSTRSLVTPFPEGLDGVDINGPFVLFFGVRTSRTPPESGAQTTRDTMSTLTPFYIWDCFINGWLWQGW